MSLTEAHPSTNHSAPGAEARTSASGRAALEHALARGFHARKTRRGCRRVEQQNNAIQIAFAGAPREHQTNRVK